MGLCFPLSLFLPHRRKDLSLSASRPSAFGAALTLVPGGSTARVCRSVRGDTGSRDLKRKTLSAPHGNSSPLQGGGVGGGEYMS